MSKLITLTCPTCGASLEISSTEKYFTCKYCGNNHVFQSSDGKSAVKSDGIACPREFHQDAILKVSSIIKGQVFSLSDSDKVFPMNSSSSKPEIYQSQLAAKLLCPSKPNFLLEILATRGGMVLCIGGIAILMGFLGNILLANLFPLGDICGFVIFFTVGVMVGIPFYANLLLPGLLKKRTEYQKQYQQWQNSRALWERSYYCQRHDIVFIQGSSKAISTDEYQAFLSLPQK